MLKKLVRKPEIAVSVKVKAIDVGEYGGRIVPVGEEFTFNGNLNRAGTLPLWVECMDPDFELPTAEPQALAPVAPVVPALLKAAPVVVKKVAAPKAPVAPKAPAAPKAPVAPKVPALKKI